MPQLPLPFMQIIIGAALVALGYHDFKMAKQAKTERSGRSGLLDQLDEALFPDLPEEMLASIKRTSSALMGLAGLAICFGALV